jgi:hypothetical protein
MKNTVLAVGCRLAKGSFFEGTNLLCLQNGILSQVRNHLKQPVYPFLSWLAL